MEDLVRIEIRLLEVVVAALNDGGRSEPVAAQSRRKERASLEM